MYPTFVGPGSLCKWRPTCHVLKYLKVIIQTWTFLNKYKICSTLHDKHNFINNIEAGFKFRVLWLLGVTSGQWWPGRAGLSLPSPLSLDWGLPPSLHTLVQPALWVASQTHAGHSTPPVQVSLGYFHQLTLPPTAPPHHYTLPRPRDVPSLHSGGQTQEWGLTQIGWLETGCLERKFQGPENSKHGCGNITLSLFHMKRDAVERWGSWAS